MSADNALLTKAMDVFRQKLESRGLRKTPERFAILREIYSSEGHLDVDNLYEHMLRNDYRVSRATVYNTLELLVEFDLVKKQRFDNNLTLFEKSLGYKQHDHVICTRCGAVQEFCDPRIHHTKAMVAEIFGYAIQRHSLNIFGLCPECRQKEKASSADTE